MHAPFFLLLVALTAASVFHALNPLIPLKYRPPASVLLFTFGAALPTLGAAAGEEVELLASAIQRASHVDPNLVFCVLRFLSNNFVAEFYAFVTNVD